MGDISEIRGLIVVGTFISILVLLMMWVPAEFFFISDQRRVIPTEFEGIDIVRFAVTWNASLDGSHPSISPYTYHFFDAKVAGHDLRFHYALQNRTFNSDSVFSVHHIIYWAGIITDTVPCEFFHRGVPKGTALNKAELDGAYEVGDLTFTFQSETFTMEIFFGFNETIYDKPSVALNDYAMKIMIGVEWDQVATGMSAWDLVAMILFFKLPDIHWIVNAIIAVPIWIAIGYLSFILILRAIGAIFGGGA